jgi:hypothetical protein
MDIKKHVMRVWTELIWLRMGSSDGLLERDNETSGPFKGGAFIDSSKISASQKRLFSMELVTWI